MTTVPVKGAVLEWARKFRGLDEIQAAKKLGISVADLADYENERRQPSVTLFVRSAKANAAMGRIRVRAARAMG
jgi:transcriptional regulator with XRE-family HTH domain